MSKEGILYGEYHQKRETRLSLKYRLRRRTDEVLDAIKTFKGDDIKSILDVGTADGLMLDRLNENLDICRAVGLDMSMELLKSNTNCTSQRIQSNAIKLPFKDNSFDVIVAAAIIEHVSDAKTMLKECNRVLRKSGLCIITTPDPFFENIATKIGHIKEEQHIETFNLQRLKFLLSSNGFKILNTKKFMISPIGFPFEKTIEKVMSRLGLECLMLNQLIVGQKT